MIFVTVGTHEQQFDRVIKEIDTLVQNKTINDEVFVQIGYSTYIPTHCKWKEFLSYNEMQEKINTARIVITHGGPASFLSVLEKKKIPIVVPRRLCYGEHVNDHQLDFSLEIKNRGYNFILVEDIHDLGSKIVNYNEENRESFVSNNKNFNKKLEKLVKELLGE
ncbi:glycosyltransferase family 28 [Enterococcus innesii]|uniref:Glycosyltransferase family 28 n=1 Tax=Enterococcus innesii TaxID=2839759 RepID=A0ABM7XPP9_9ENTE|nr:PssE/Cps14G family polysaccharide biosynthesis glycosyltransferase [Enterococcus innesii]BDG67025.1 glycosyltransferase family 28 [Enterococcus innesii]